MLTPLERESQEFVAVFLDMAAVGRPLNRTTQLTIMTMARALHSHLINKQNGCVRGLHAASCHCKEGE